MSPRIVIVGGGECGARAALALRRNGHEGPVSLLSAEGHAPYERPPLSKEALSGPDEPTPRFIADSQKLAEAGIAFEADTSVSMLDLSGRHVGFTDGRSLAFDKLLIATGAIPRMPEGILVDARVCVLRNYADALKIRKLASPGSHVVVIGGGFIGLETAASCRARGCEVTVLEATTRLMGRIVPEEVGLRIGHYHERAGVSIVRGARIAALSRTGDAISVDLVDGRALRADVVVVGTGVDPDTRLAVRAGLRIENGIAVNGELETQVDGVYAGGDCCSFPLELFGGKRVRLEAWRNAQLHGELIARNMLGAGTSFSAVPWFWSDQYDLTLQIAGLPAEGVDTVVRRFPDGAEVWFHLDADGRLVAATGLGVGNAVAREVRIAEMLIARRKQPPRERLAETETPLKSLLTV